MRPTVIRLIAGGALGVAFSISLTLPGSVVFPAEPPIRQLAAPEAPTATVLRAAPVVRARKALPRPRVVVQRVYVPTAGTVPAPRVVDRTPPRSKPSRKPVERAPVPVTPLATRPAAPVSEPVEEPKEAEEAEEPREADEPKKAERPRKSGKPKAEKPRKADKTRKSEKPKKAKKPKDPGSRKNDSSDGKKDRSDPHGDEDGHGSGRGNSLRG